jgi:DNA invertase Pin-like site-specific DNA recombinase
MDRYVAYYRVSTKRQGESGLGLEAQVRMVEGYARNGVIIKEFTEKETGTSKRERPILAEAIISSLSRTGVDFVCCDNPNANKLTINLLASVAESEAEAISSRTKAGLGSIKERIKKDGSYVSRSGRMITSLGNPGNLTDEGRRKGGDVISQRFKNNRNTRMARPYAMELRGRGLELKEIAEKLNSNGFITATGRQFNKYSVHKLIK